MSVVSRTLGAGAAMLMIAAALSPGAIAGPVPTLTFGASVAQPGASIAINGTGFAPTTSYDLTSDRGTMQNSTVTTDSSGAFTTRLSAPVRLPCFTTISVSVTPAGSPAGTTPVRESTIPTSECRLSLSDSGILRAGQRVGITGTGYASGETVRLTSRQGRLTVGSAVARADGTWSVAESIIDPIRPHFVTIDAAGALSGRTPSTRPIDVQDDVLWAGDTVRPYESLQSLNARYFAGPDNAALTYGPGAPISYYRPLIVGPGVQHPTTAATSMSVTPQGQLVLTVRGSTIWSSHTTGTNAHLVMRNDSNLVLYNGAGHVLWQTQPIRPTLAAGHALLAGQMMRPYAYWPTLTMQSNGDLVLHGKLHALWSSHTYVPGSHLVLSTTGDLAVVTPAGHIAWHTRTHGRGALLRDQNDSNLVLRAADGTVLWFTHTKWMT